MTFPVTWTIGPFHVPAHLVFEWLAYFAGFRLYLWFRSREGDPLATADRWTIVAAAAAGAALGSKVLFWLSDPVTTLHNWSNPYYLLAGNTIAGALLGGLVVVEAVKRYVGIRRNTGDLFAVPLAAGIAIGRIGCFLSGTTDRTHGNPTTLPWGVDLGDGLRRHPVQLYEVAWLGLLAVLLLRFRARPHREGDVFKLFMVGYFVFRFFVEFLKPGVPLAGLVAIQWAALGALVYYRKDLPRLLGARRAGEVS